jgi:hypothetical protein
LPDECARIVARAEAIRRHDFDLLGYERLDFGEEIDWHLDPVSGKRSPFCPWYKVPFLDFERVGDAKVTWELNRHQHLVTLAKAYRLTGEESFADEIARQWTHWWASNPYPMGTNWASALEVAFRGLSWLWVKHLLADTPALSRDLAADIDRGLALSGRHLELYLSTYFSANTHLLGEAVALFFIGLLTPGIEGSRRWREHGWEILLEQSRTQYLADGLHFERSSYYHVYALDFFLHSRILAERNGMDSARELDGPLQRQLDVLCALSSSGGVFRFGDDDGGRLFDGARNRSEHLLDPLATGAALFGRDDLAGSVDGIREETLWLLGREGVGSFDRLSSDAPRGEPRAFGSSEMYVMSSEKPASCRVLIGPGARPGLVGGHAHADLLALQLTLGGKELLSDSGTYVYVDGDGNRNRFRSTAAHNTLEVDGGSQAVPAGPFSWQGLSPASTDLWIASADFDLFIGHHDGYSRPAALLRHCRWVFNLRSGFVLVRDVVTGGGTRRLDLRWHLAAGASLLESGPGRHAVSFDDRPELAIVTRPDHGWRASVDRGAVSPVYGKKESRDVLRYSHETALPAEFVTVLHPVSGATAAGELRRVVTDTSAADSAGRFAGNVAAYAYDTNDASHLFFFSTEGEAWRFGDWESDARFVHCAMGESRRPAAAAVVGGSSLAYRGERRTSPDPIGDYWTWRS